jgi:hypothetical protein
VNSAAFKFRRVLFRRFSAIFGKTRPVFCNPSSSTPTVRHGGAQQRPPILFPAFFHPSASHRATPLPHLPPLLPAIAAASAPPIRSRDGQSPLQIAASLSCCLQRGAGTPRLAPDLLLFSLICCSGFAVWP